MSNAVRVLLSLGLKSISNPSWLQGLKYGWFSIAIEIEFSSINCFEPLVFGTALYSVLWIAPYP